jgi:hypothetical protein
VIGCRVLPQSPDAWDIDENPPYAYWLYYMWANLVTLNRLREARGLNTFDLRYVLHSVCFRRRRALSCFRRPLRNTGRTVASLVTPTIWPRPSCLLAESTTASNCILVRLSSICT